MERVEDHPAVRAAREPKVWNKHHGDAPIGAVHVGRSTKWGNPFVIGTHGDRREVILKFIDVLIARKDELVPTIRKELGGKHLECFCAPKMCHADVLLAVANCEEHNVDHILRISREVVSVTPVAPVMSVNDAKAIATNEREARDAAKARAKPFNDNVRKAFPDALSILDDNIKYLEGIIAHSANSPTLFKHTKAKQENLQRVREWMASHLETHKP